MRTTPLTNTKTPRQTLLSLALGAGLAIGVGCRSTADRRAIVEGSEGTSTIQTAATTGTGDASPTDAGFYNETAWGGIVNAGDTNPRGNNAQEPLSLWGDIGPRGRTTDDLAAGAFDPFDVTRVTFSPEGADFDPQVTPDGRFVYFASTRHRETSDIYIKGISGRAVRQLTTDPAHDVMPAISPDGTRLAFASDRAGGWDIYVTDVNGGQARPITNTSAHELHPTWSPDGSRLAFCRLGETSGRWEIWIVEVDNPLVSYHIGYGLFPDWCPVPGTGVSGGDRILFQRSRERGSRLFSIWTMDVEGNSEAGYLTELASDPNAALINPAWSPDGRRIAFTRATIDGSESDQPESGDVMFMNIDGSGLTNLTADDAVNLMPAWGRSPSGSDSVYFVSDREGTNSIWALNVRDAILAAGEPRNETLPVTARNGVANQPTNTTTAARTPQGRDASGTVVDPNKAPAGDNGTGLTTFVDQP